MQENSRRVWEMLEEMKMLTDQQELTEREALESAIKLIGGLINIVGELQEQVDTMRRE